MLPVYRHICDFPERVGCDVVSWHVVDLNSDRLIVTHVQNDYN